MAENIAQGDKQVKDIGDEQGKSSEQLAKQSMDGREDLSKTTVDYYASRKAGARDRITQQLLPIKPEFYDSSAPAAAKDGDVVLASAQKVQRAAPDASADDAAVPVRGGSVDRNPGDGKVSSVTYPDGHKKSFEYGPNGELTKFADQNGSWRKEGDSWNLYDKQGNSTGQSLEQGSKCAVDKKGDFIFTQKDGTKTIQAPDGSSVIKNPDGTVARVNKPDGDSSKYEYGPHGELTKFTNKDGASWKKEGDSWNQYDKSDHKTGQSLQKGSSCAVDSDGKFIFKEKDGTKTTSAPDGSVVINDPTGKVSRVTNSDGVTTKFEYGPHGDLTRFTNKDGLSWKKDADGWNQYDQSNNKTGATLDKGTNCATDSDGSLTITHPDGTKDIFRPSGEWVTDLTHQKKSRPISL